jgi:hypothetical protein
MFDLIHFLSLILILFVLIKTFFAENVVSRSIDKKTLHENFETGDLVFVNYNNPFGYFMRGWTNSVWTHVGMIMKSEEGIFVLETSDYSRDGIKTKLKKEKGILVVPFDEWMNLNKNHMKAYSSLKVPKSYDRNNILLAFLKIQEKNLDGFSVGPDVWSKVLFKLPYEYSDNVNRNITCFELIIKVYQDSNVMKKVYTPGSYYTSDIIKRELDFCDGFSLVKAKYI